MISLVETGLMNALLAVVLALPVFALGRLCHRPALIHAFWILVLVKLIAPPLYLIPVRVSLPVTDGVSSRLGLAGNTNISMASTTGSPSEAGNGRQLQATVPSRVYVDSPSSWTSYWQTVAGTGLRGLRRLAWPALCLWFCGSACWFAWQGWRIVRFTQVFLIYARRGPAVLQHLSQRLASQMGIAQAPEVWLLPAVVSPMLWSVGGKPRILFPKDLLNRLDEGAVATLLTHELAHYRRGDHRVRLLEFLASGLFWWHPVIWLARRELEISEEKCCDAWVVSQFPAAQRQYADALLATVDFLTEDHPALPATACGLGEVPLLRQRLKLIMRGTAPKSLSLLGRAAVVATAMLIPISPSLRLHEQTPVLEAAVSRPKSAVEIRTAMGILAMPQVQTTMLAATRLAADSDGFEQPRISSLVPMDSVPKNSIAAIGNLVPGCNTCGPEAAERQQPVSEAAKSPENSYPSVTTSQFILRVFGRSPEGAPSASPELQDGLKLMTCHRDSVLFVADGKVSLTGSRDGALRVWNLQPSDIHSHLTDDIQGALHGSGCDTLKPCVSGANSDGSDCWAVDEMQAIEPVTMAPLGVQSLSLSRQGLTLASSVGSSQKTAVLLVRFTNNGKLLLSRKWYGMLVTWDLGAQIRITK